MWPQRRDGKGKKGILTTLADGSFAALTLWQIARSHCLLYGEMVFVIR
jgi:hypothetical protein